MAMKQDSITNPTKSLDNICHKLKTEAPTTLRIPISLVLCSATKDASPNKPRHEIKMARMAKKVARLPIRSSSENFRAYSSSIFFKYRFYFSQGIS